MTNYLLVFAGFISIDCGLEGDSNYTEKFSGIIYSPDSGYVDGGVNVDVPRTPDLSSLAQGYGSSWKPCVLVI